MKLTVVLGCSLFLSGGAFARAAPDRPVIKPDVTNFQAAPGWTIDWIASEPNIASPVALAFDEQNRLFVLEFPNYPNLQAPGRIRCLRDSDADGYWETSRLFVESLDSPHSILPWAHGILVISGVNLIHFQDKDNDDRAEHQTVLAKLPTLTDPMTYWSGLEYRIDHAIYGYTAAIAPKAGIVGKAWEFRFDPITQSTELLPGRFISGAASDYGFRQFVCTDDAHGLLSDWPWDFRKAFQFLLPDEGWEQISDHGSRCQIFPRSMLEPRFNQFGDAGFLTSACGLLWVGQNFSLGELFLCDPAHNLIHRDTLVPGSNKSASGLRAARAEEGSEFLSSTDPHFRPVFLASGPDGAIYGADFRRPFIEHPSVISLEMQTEAEFLRGSDLGRIYRIASKTASAKEPTPSRAGPESWIGNLGHSNSWRRLMAQRLLLEAEPPVARDLLVQALDGPPLARMHGFSILRARGLWDLSLFESAVQDPSPSVRRLALVQLRLEPQFARRHSVALQKSLRTLAGDPEGMVRREVLTTVALLPWLFQPELVSDMELTEEMGPALIAAAIGREQQVLQQLIEKQRRPGHTAARTNLLQDLMVSLAEGAGRRGAVETLSGFLRTLAESDQAPDEALDAFARGAYFRGVDLPKLSRSAEAVRSLKQRMGRTTAVAFDAWLPDRSQIESFLSRLVPTEELEVQLSALRSLVAMERSEVIDLLLNRWSSFTPKVRETILRGLLLREAGTKALRERLAGGTIQWPELSAFETSLSDSPDLQAALRELRPQVFESAPLEVSPGDATRGRHAFIFACHYCHNHRKRSEGLFYKGNFSNVGPILLRRDDVKELTRAIVRPDAQISPEGFGYIVRSKEIQAAGLIVEENNESMVLRDTLRSYLIPRRDLLELVCTGRSYMPAELASLAREDLADILAYLIAE